MNNPDVTDQCITADMMDSLNELQNNLIKLEKNAIMNIYMNIPTYDFITKIMPIMNDIQSELDNKSKNNSTFSFGTRVE